MAAITTTGTVRSVTRGNLDAANCVPFKSLEGSDWLEFKGLDLIGPFSSHITLATVSNPGRQVTRPSRLCVHSHVSVAALGVL